jgi:hypothetical protein
MAQPCCIHMYLQMGRNGVELNESCWSCLHFFALDAQKRNDGSVYIQRSHTTHAAGAAVGQSEPHTPWQLPAMLKGWGACAGQFSCKGSPAVLVCKRSKGGQRSVVGCCKVTRSSKSILGSQPASHSLASASLRATHQVGLGRGGTLDQLLLAS